MLSPIGAAAGKAGHPFDKLRTGVRLLANKKPQVKIWGFLSGWFLMARLDSNTIVVQLSA
jgi:hypothetical protein